jgi:diacylglycerol kinase (ATP)
MLFIINPAAGAGRAGTVWGQFERELKARGVRSEKSLTQAKGDAKCLALAGAGRHSLVIAVGGDGTVSEVADGILGSKAPCTKLGLVPCGTGNDFGRVLGIRTPMDAIQAMEGGRTTRADVIQVECDVSGKRSASHAVSFAAVGIAAEAQRQTTVFLKRIVGERWAYRLGIVRALLRYHPPRMRVNCDGRTWEDWVLFLCASNGENLGGGMRIAPGARIDDGRFEVNIVRKVSWWRALAQLRRLSRGRHTGHPDVRYLQALSLQIDADPVSEVAVDGDIIGQTPARFEVRPAALRVVVPP